MTPFRTTAPLRSWLPVLALVAWGSCATVRTHAQDICDSTIVLDFVPTDTNLLTYVFPVSVASGNATIVSVPQWGFMIDGAVQTFEGHAPFVQFPHPGDYLACVEALVVTQQQTTCMAAHCELITVEAISPTCHDTLVPDFTITLDGDSVVFIDQSITAVPIASYTWTFDDGTIPTTTSLPHIAHHFPASGPYQVCLSVDNGNGCFGEICKWVYFGPPNVSCDTILQPDIVHAEVGLTTALYDASITSGMEHATTWDLGDGSHAIGPAVIHTYLSPGTYVVSATTSAWGPLTTDTCVHVTSLFITVPMTVAGIDERNAGETLSAYPQPFLDRVTVEGAPPGAQWQLADLAGRVLAQGRVPMIGPLTLNGQGYHPGVYVLRAIAGERVAALRLVKE